MKLKPLIDRVIIQDGGGRGDHQERHIILTGAAKEKPEVAEVVAVGPGGMVDGKEIVMTVRLAIKLSPASTRHPGQGGRRGVTIVRQGDIPRGLLGNCSRAITRRAESLRPQAAPDLSQKIRAGSRP